MFFLSFSVAKGKLGKVGKSGTDVCNGVVVLVIVSAVLFSLFPVKMSMSDGTDTGNVAAVSDVMNVLSDTSSGFGVV